MDRRSPQAACGVHPDVEFQEIESELNDSCLLLKAKLARSGVDGRPRFPVIKNSLIRFCFAAGVLLVSDQ